MNLHDALAAPELAELRYHGFSNGRPIDPDDENVKHEIIACMNVLIADPAIEKLLKKRGSYGLKHLVERAVRTYIANGSLILAAWLLGWRPVRKYPNGPNCRFARM